MSFFAFSCVSSVCVLYAALSQTCKVLLRRYRVLLRRYRVLLRIFPPRNIAGRAVQHVSYYLYFIFLNMCFIFLNMCIHVCILYLLRRQRHTSRRSPDSSPRNIVRMKYVSRTLFHVIRAINISIVHMNYVSRTLFHLIQAIHISLFPPLTEDYRSLLQNMVSFIGLFCKRAL